MTKNFRTLYLEQQLNSIYPSRVLSKTNGVMCLILTLLDSYTIDTCRLLEWGLE